MKLYQLCRSASEKYASQGHELGPWEARGYSANLRAVALCHRCGKLAEVKKGKRVTKPEKCEEKQ